MNTRNKQLRGKACTCTGNSLLVNKTYPVESYLSLFNTRVTRGGLKWCSHIGFAIKSPKGSFAYTRFGWISFCTVVFGQFKKPKQTVLTNKPKIFYVILILLICQFGHFSFAKLFLSIAWYMVIANFSCSAWLPTVSHYFWFQFIISSFLFNI